MKRGFVCIALCILGVFSAVVSAYPTPAGVQQMDEWTLKVTYTQPQQIMFSHGRGESDTAFLVRDSDGYE